LISQSDAFPTTTTTAQSNVGWTFTRNPASELAGETRTNDSYAYSTLVNASPSYTVNGLNQYTGVGTTSFCYDANGNLTADGSSVYLYDVENRLVQKRAQTSSTCPTATTGYSGTLQANICGLVRPTNNVSRSRPALIDRVRQSNGCPRRCSKRRTG
jgi:hypothetical protein